MLCIHRFETLGSTNDEAIRLARVGAPSGTVVWAEQQTTGRGRMGRSWDGGAGNVFLSVLLRPDLLVSLSGRLSVACGLALAETLRNETWQPVRTKWPNDLYLYGRKVGGILVETGSAPGGQLEWAVVGVGVNVASHPDVPVPGQPATSLAAHGGAGDVGTLIPSLAQAVVAAAEASATGAGWGAVIAKWPRLDLACGDITVVEASAIFAATGVGIEEDGSLTVRVRGALHRVTAGEVSLRAPADAT